MALIIRIDVDRPYGRHPLARHLLSRLSSDLYFPSVTRFGYLAELGTMLSWLNASRRRAHVFFRRCTLPSEPIQDLLEAGRLGRKSGAGVYEYRDGEKVPGSGLRASLL